MSRAQNAQRPLALIADDQPVLRELLAHMLEDEGWNTRLAADGDSLIGLMESAADPEAIVVDRGMPGPGLGTLIRDLRRRAPRARIVVWSGDPEAAAMETRHLGVDAVVAKPGRVESLVAAVRGQALMEVA